MKENLRDLIKKIRATDNILKRADYQLELLYQIQYQEKVANGYEIWRLNENGGIELVKNQLKTLNYQCPICGVGLTEKEATIDHLKPKYKYLGQAISTDNMLIMCRSCNGGKGRRELKDWYQNLPTQWQKRLYHAIKKIHGQMKLIELGLETINGHNAQPPITKSKIKLPKLTPNN